MLNSYYELVSTYNQIHDITEGHNCLSFSFFIFFNLLLTNLFLFISQTDNCINYKVNYYAER